MSDPMSSDAMQRDDALNAAKTRLLTLIARGVSLSETLDAVCREYQSLVPGSICSLMLPDPEDGLMLRSKAGPDLPADYLAAVDGITVGPQVGSCGSAFFSRQRVIVSDIATSPFWADYAPTALSHNLRSCWSTPVLIDETGPALAVFGIYRRTIHYPSAWEQDVADQFVALVAIAIQRDQSETILRRAKRDAEKASIAKSVFLANMSHELRTPLNAILGFAELIKMQTRGPLPAAYNSYTDYILTSGRYLATLISDILDVARIEVGKVDLVDETIPLHALAEECVNLLRHGDEHAYEAVVSNEIHPDLLLRVDRRSMTQIMLNLIGNALKFTPKGGKVHIESSHDDDRITLQIRDNGIGIPSDKLADLGQPFTQIENAMSRHYRGSGLGLFIVKSLTHLHGGTMTITSAAGQGTTVRLDLPRERLVA